jgi:hypothetical protein
MTCGTHPLASSSSSPFLLFPTYASILFRVAVSRLLLPSHSAVRGPKLGLTRTAAAAGLLLACALTRTEEGPLLACALTRTAVRQRPELTRGGGGSDLGCALARAAVAGRISPALAGHCFPTRRRCRIHLSARLFSPLLLRVRRGSSLLFSSVASAAPLSSSPPRRVRHSSSPRPRSRPASP